MKLFTRCSFCTAETDSWQHAYMYSLIFSRPLINGQAIVMRCPSVRPSVTQMHRRLSVALNSQTAKTKPMTV